MSITSSQIDKSVIIRRSIFFLILLILTTGNLFVLFRGLNSAQGMDQAQMAREIARGNFFTTKMIRPADYAMVQKAKEDSSVVPFVNFPDTYQAPLNPLINGLVLKLIGADKPDSWQMTTNQLVYDLDRVIATLSTLFFLASIAVTYLLICRIFDPKIAGVCAILMLFCETFWSYSLSGQPHMLMLMLFSTAIYFAYRAVEASVEGKMVFTPAILAGVFFTLLALTHWLAVWIALGYILYAAIAFRPRGIVALSIAAMILCAAGFTIYRNYSITGTPFGSSFYALYNGLGSGQEAVAMRTLDLENQAHIEDALISRILRSTLLQSSDIISFLGGIIAAPLFFLALLHPFKRPAIANFRWAILVMWIFAAIGMSFYGVTKNRLDPNQLHLLFAPIMTAYGLAFLSILWSRLDIVASTPQLKNVHHMIVIAICALPLIIELPQRVRGGMAMRDHGGSPNWPPYLPGPLNNKDGLKAYTSEKDIVVSDQPWATAWYADRMSIWLPQSRENFEKLESVASDLQTPIAGILISPSSYGVAPVDEVLRNYEDFSSMVLDGSIARATTPARPSEQFPRYGVILFKNDQHLENIAKHYPNRVPFYGYQMIFYTDKQPQAKTPATR